LRLPEFDQVRDEGEQFEIVGQTADNMRCYHSPEAERRSEMISFGAVIVNDVENHLDAG
jgi:hypothetical protein